MIGILLKVGLLFSFLNGFIEANPFYEPRMKFTQKETAVTRLPLPGHHAPVQILLEEQTDTVIAVGQTSLKSYNFEKPMETPIEKELCLKPKDCTYNITMVHKREEADQVFVCGTNAVDTVCCDMNLSDQTPVCNEDKMKNIEEAIKGFTIKEGEPSAFVESAESVDLYVTYSGSQDYVGVHKFGKDRVGPGNHDKEQYYVGLMPSSQKNDSKQDKVYAFYKERNKGTGLDSEMWLPFVTRVCMADVGGPKNNLQFSWTSQMNARLFCGDPDNRQHFSELVDVATVHADSWQDTRVYGLFRNEWGMSAVCVYTIHDIDNIFTNSPFKGDSTENHKDRPRTCVEDSRKISLETLRKIEKTSEMEQWVRPVDNSGPLLFNLHNYTHIYVASSQDKINDDHTVLFLSLNNGRIHKVVHKQNLNLSLVIAEYQPFNYTTHVLSMILHPSSRKLYVSSRSELAQLDVANCAKYGDGCKDCILARDPYCGWNGTHCTPDGTQQDVTSGNHAICLHPPRKAFRSTSTHADKDVDTVMLPAKSKYFLQCPVSSYHAKYTWNHLKTSTSCSLKEEHCLFLIDSMGPEQVGTYQCVSEEMGYRKVLAQYKLQLESRAVSRLPSPLVWVCLMAVLIKSSSC